MQINKSGCAVMIIWVVAFIFYMYVRIAKTMDLGQYLAYGIYVLIVEVLHHTLTRQSASEPSVPSGTSFSYCIEPSSKRALDGW